MKKVLVVLLGLISSLAYGQFGYNPNAVRPVLEDDVMFRKIVQRRINMNEKQNKGFAPQGENEETEQFNFVLQLYKAMQEGKIQPFEHSSSANIVRFQSLSGQKKVSTPEEGPDKPCQSVTDNKEQKGTPCYVDFKEEPEKYDYFMTIGCIEKDPSGNPIVNANGDPIIIITFPRMDEIRAAPIKITEEVIFDKRRSRMYINILAVTIELYCKSDPNKKIYYHFRYKDVDKYFREKYQETQTVGAWYNPQNMRRHMCVMDAFELRLFSSRIIKVSNPDDLSLAEMYKSPNGTITEELYKAQEAENELMEFEHNLWEF